MEFPKLTTGEIIGGAAIGVGAAVLGGAAGYAIGKKTKSKSKKRKSSSRNKSSRKKIHRTSRGRKLKFGSKAYRKKYLKHGKKKQRQPHTAGKRKDTSHKRIRWTKNNHPYIIKPDGRAKFIKMSSVSRSKKLKGGKY